MVTRRSVLGAVALGSVAAPALAQRGPRPALYRPAWESLIEHYRTPDWFRDAKFGIWAHWGVGCIPEAGDWYARRMYVQGDPFYNHHVKTYGHPSQFGFMDLIHQWNVDAWEPEKLLDLYKGAGAKYFVGMANHHDNFDNYNSRHHRWNSVNIGPKTDIIGRWAKAARDRGLRFGVSNHASHAWHWFQTAYAYDAEGYRAGDRYDAFNRTRADGAGKWWAGLDPQDLYCGRNMVIPDGVKTIASRNDWHEKNDRRWMEEPPSMNPRFTATWLARCKDLVDQYKPDLLYFDNADLPLGQAGLEMAAHYYNRNMAWHGGDQQAVINIKDTPPQRRSAVVHDVERGLRAGIAEHPWQTDTCLGDWHYNRTVYSRGQYKSAASVIHRLCDTVSKNGNLLLSVPVRANGSIDEKEHAIVVSIGEWMAVNGEAIFGSRPWRTFGGGPTTLVEGVGERSFNTMSAEDIRFTTRAGTVYALTLGSPTAATIRLADLGEGSPHGAGRVERVELLGDTAPLRFTRHRDALVVELPPGMPQTAAAGLKIQGAGLTAATGTTK